MPISLWSDWVRDFVEPLGAPVGCVKITIEIKPESEMVVRYECVADTELLERILQVAKEAKL